MTGLLAVAVVSGLERHVVDVAVFAGAALVAGLRPRLTPYVVVLGVLFQSSATHVMTSDGLVLAGAAAGLAFLRLWSGEWPTRADVPAALVVLLALDALMAASLMANLGGPAQGLAAQATGYFVSRSLLVGAVVVLVLKSAVSLRDWLAAGAVGTLAIGVARLLEVTGLPLHPLASSLSIALLGDVRDVGTWNEFAITMVAGALMALMLAIAWPRSQRATALWTAAAVITLVAGATGQSRTATFVVLVLFALLIVTATSARYRGVLASAGVVFLVVAVTPAGSILDKPLVVQASQSAAQTEVPAPVPVAAPPASPSPSATAAPAATTAPPFVTHTVPRNDWRAVLDRPYYRIDQTFSHPVVYDHGNYLAVMVRSSAHSSRVRLRVTVDGQTIDDVGADRIPSFWGWIVVPIPDGTVTRGEDVTVTLSATGPLDSRTHYVSVGGTDGFASDVTSRAYAHGTAIKDDLSSDPGLQRGLVIAFLNGREPTIARFRPGPQAVLDTSLSDRIALWTSAWRIFLAHPALGAGFRTFQSLHDQYATSPLFFPYDNAHSNFFELLADLGPLGPLLLLLLMSIVLVPLLVRAARAGWTGNWQDLALAAIVAVMLLASVTQTWIGDSRVAMFFWLFLLVAGASAPPVSLLVRSRPGAGEAAPAAAPERPRRQVAAAAGWLRRLPRDLRR